MVKNVRKNGPEATGSKKELEFIEEEKRKLEAEADKNADVLDAELWRPLESSRQVYPQRYTTTRRRNGGRIEEQ